MNQDVNLLRLILDASFVVQLVMLVLLAASVASWAIILRKRKLIEQMRRASDEFETNFWSGGDLAKLYRALEQKKEASAGLENLFAAGFREFSKLRQQPQIDPAQLMEGARRGMKAAQLKEIEVLEHNLAVLATVGSTSPYVGLFGTVWGIMHAFVGLGSVQQATLAMVAPGIAEALIATAIGLFAAIPAVVAYNRFADQVSRLELRFDTFMEEFTSILQRHAARPT